MIESDTSSESGGSEPDRVLHLVEGYAGFLLVSPSTISLAIQAQREADAVPWYENFGELRRSGNIDFLAERLDRFMYPETIDDYVAAIERFADRAPASSDTAERLAALSDVQFLGDDDISAPSDSDDIYSLVELDQQVEDVYADELEKGMIRDVPRDILQKFKVSYVPMFGDGNTRGVIDDDQLEPMISALETLGYTIIRDGTPGTSS